MYTIKILQRLIDRETHNSIFAFVLLILKTISRELHFGKRRATAPEPKSPRPAPRLPPSILASNLAAEPPIEKGKLPETRLSKNTAPELCERTFLPPVCTGSATSPSAATLTELSFTERSRQIRGGLLSNPISGDRASNFFVNRETFSNLADTSEAAVAGPLSQRGAGHWID
jgi:hypothetical protein